MPSAATATRARSAKPARRIRPPVPGVRRRRVRDDRRRVHPEPLLQQRAVDAAEVRGVPQVVVLVERRPARGTRRPSRPSPASRSGSRCRPPRGRCPTRSPPAGARTRSTRARARGPASARASRSRWKARRLSPISSRSRAGCRAGSSGCRSRRVSIATHLQRQAAVDHRRERAQPVAKLAGRVGHAGRGREPVLEGRELVAQPPGRRHGGARLRQADVARRRPPRGRRRRRASCPAPRPRRRASRSRSCPARPRSPRARSARPATAGGPSRGRVPAAGCRARRDGRGSGRASPSGRTGSSRRPPRSGAR